MNSRIPRLSRNRRTSLFQAMERRILFSFVLQPAGTTISATAAAGSSQSENSNPSHAEDTFSIPGSQFQPAYSLDALSNASYQVTPQQLTLHDDATQSSIPAGSLWPDGSGADSGTTVNFTLTAAATIQIRGTLTSTGGGSSSVSFEGIRASSDTTSAINQALNLTAGNYTLFVTADAADQAGPSDSSATADITLTISGGTPPQITSPNAATFHLGVPSHFTVTTIGSPTPTIKETAFLPVGITFVDNHNGTATLAGTPKSTDATGHYDLIFSASNGVSVDATHPAANQFFTLTLTGAAVQPPPPTKITFTVQPATTSAGAIFAPLKFSLLDSSGHLATSNNSHVTLTLAGTPGAVLHGTTTVQAVNGVATFTNLSITKAGTYTLIATDGSLNSTSKTFTINPDAKTAHLVLTQKPTAGVVIGKLLTPATALLEDQYGNLIKNNSSAVTLALVKGPTNGKPLGTTTLHLANGAVTFKSISLTQPGAYTLRLIDTALPHTNYPPPTFTVTATKPAIPTPH